MRTWYWLPLVALALAVVLLLTRRRLAGAITPKSPAVAETATEAIARTQDPTGLLAQLQTACLADDARAAALTLLQLGRTRWPQDPPNNLGELAQRLVDGRETIMALDRALYAADASYWDGAELWRLVSESWQQDRSPPQRAPEALTPLYPNRS